MHVTASVIDTYYKISDATWRKIEQAFIKSINDLELWPGSLHQEHEEEPYQEPESYRIDSKITSGNCTWLIHGMVYMPNCLVWNYGHDNVMEAIKEQLEEDISSLTKPIFEYDVEEEHRAYSVSIVSLQNNKNDWHDIKVRVSFEYHIEERVTA